MRHLGEDKLQKKNKYMITMMVPVDKPQVRKFVYCPAVVACPIPL